MIPTKPAAAGAVALCPAGLAKREPNRSRYRSVQPVSLSFTSRPLCEKSGLGGVSESDILVQPTSVDFTTDIVLRAITHTLIAARLNLR